MIGFWILGSIKSYQMPSYDGKTVEEWFFGKGWPPNRQNPEDNATVVLEALGTKCIPYLIEKAKGKETLFNRLYCKIHPKLPPFLRKRIPLPIHASSIQHTAFNHLLWFGSTELDPFASDLMEIVPKIESNLTRGLAFSMMKNSLIRSDNMRSKTEYLLSFVNDPCFDIQLDAMILLAKLDTTITNGIPTLTTALTNRSSFGSTLGGVIYVVGSQAHNDVVNSIQQRAYIALAAIAPDLAQENVDPSIFTSEEINDFVSFGPPSPNDTP